MIYFTSLKWLQDNTPINENVDAKKITPLVKGAADMFVRSVLGTYFYNDLLTKYNAQTLSADEEVLVADYIKFTIGWKVASELAVTSAYDLKNKGPQTQSGDYSASPEYKAIMFLVHHYADKSDFYLNRLSQYLIDNKTLFINFTSDLNTDSTAKKSCGNGSNNFTNNILFI
jgi:hypothetical protein